MTIEWVDGQRDEEVEDYEPWTLVNELRRGSLDWDEGPHAGHYTVDWVGGDDRTALVQRLSPG